MKFPVIGEGIDHAGPVDPKTAAMSLEYVINPSLEIVDSWIQKNEVQGGILAGQREGALIIDAKRRRNRRHAAESSILGSHKMGCYPIQTVRSAIEGQKKIIEALKQAASSMDPR